MQSRRVLIVEDDAGLRASLTRGLAGPSLDVVAVPDGASALAAASPPSAPFDVIVMDIGLPDSDGRDVCQALRARGVPRWCCSSPLAGRSAISSAGSPPAVTTT